MNVTPRAAALLALVALLGIFIPWPLAVLAFAAALGVITVDALVVRHPPQMEESMPRILARGVSQPYSIGLEAGNAAKVVIRQPRVPDIGVEPAIATDARLEGTLHARRRGRHRLPASAARLVGPFRLGAWHHRGAEEHELLVYPDVVEATRLRLLVRRGRFQGSGLRVQGPLGLGTDFESIRDYLPDDDIRQLNWRATERLGRPMSNQYRLEQDREVTCVIDTGRLMAAPLDGKTRLDAALDAAVAVAAVSEELGDHCGVIAFDAEIRRELPPRRRAYHAVLSAVFDLEPVRTDSDYQLAFQAVGTAKRSLVFVFTDLLDEAAARSLVQAMPLLSRRHAVAVASALDIGLADLLEAEPKRTAEVFAAVAARDVLAARRRVVLQLGAAGATVVEARPERLPAACVETYLREKRRARL